MDRAIQAVVARLHADPDEIRELERKRMSEVYTKRYLASPTHEWFVNLAMDLHTVGYNFTFTESDNSALIATYDLYLGRDEWFQIVYELSENGTATIRVSDKNGHKTWEGEDLAELWGYIISAYRNPKTQKSVVG